MKAGEPVTIHLNVDWRVLLVVLIGAALIVAISGGVLAQDGGPRTINDGASALPETAPPAAATPSAVPPAGAAAGELLLTINGEWVERDSLGSPARAEEAAAASSGRLYYLTNNNYLPNVAASACASGYHMASLWEIVDPSNLTYAADHPAAFTRADSGTGPPAGWNGWLHTGGSGSGASVAGSGNCLAWSSADGAQAGTTVRLSTNWAGTAAEVSPWDASAFSCSLVGPVWCIGD